MLYLRMMRPMVVMRGSLRHLEDRAGLFVLRTSRAAMRASASTTIERNLIIWK